MSDPDENLRAHFDPLFDRMLRVGWLARYTFTEGKGYSQVWELKGLKIIRHLCEIAHALRIHDDLECRSMIAAVLAHCGAVPVIPSAEGMNEALEQYITSGLALDFKRQANVIVVQWTQIGRELFDVLRSALSDVGIQEQVDDAQFLFVVAAQYDSGNDIRFVPCD